MEKTIASFRDLKAWQEAHVLVLQIYTVTKIFPKEESFGLTQQLRRAGVSISSNIAEGFSRRSPREKAQFYSTALGSLTEVQSQLLIARDIQYITSNDFHEIDKQTIQVSKLTNGIIKAVKNLPLTT